MKQIPFTKYRNLGAYHWLWYKSNKHSYRDYANKTLNQFPKIGTMLDIGCGDGCLSYLFFHNGFKVLGIDNDETGISLGIRRIIREYYLGNPHKIIPGLLNGGLVSYLAIQGIQLRRMSAFDITENERHDYSVCMEVIEHVPEPNRLIDKILCVTRHYSILSTPNGEYCQPGDEDYQFWTPHEFFKLLGEERSQLIEVNQDRIIAKLIANNH